jgi:hypothetical protein
VAIVVVGVYLGDTLGTAIASIGSIILTVALLSVLYDAFLKAILLEEIYDALELQQNLRAIDLRAIVRKDQVDLEEVLAGATAVEVIPLDPISWSHQDWPRVLDCASSSKVSVEIFIPNHDSPHIEVLARRMGADSEELAQQIARLPDELGRSWDQKNAGGAGSSLRVVLYGGIPANGILRTQQRILIEIPPALGYGTTDRGALAVQLGVDGWSALVSDFIREQLAEERVPDYSQSVERSVSVPLKNHIESTSRGDE